MGNLATRNKNIDELRKEAAKRERQQNEEAVSVAVQTGIAIASALRTHEGATILPLDIQDMVTISGHVSQKCFGNGAFTFYHWLATGQAYLVRVPGGDTGYDGGIDWVFATSVRPTTSLGLELGPPPTTATFARLQMEGCGPIEPSSGAMASITSNPTRSDYGSLFWLSNVVVTQSASWRDEAPLLRALLLADHIVAVTKAPLNAQMAYLVPDGKWISNTRIATEKPSKTQSITSNRLVCMPLDTWSALANGNITNPEVDPRGWSTRIAIVPVEVSMLMSDAIWMYVLCFLDTMVWNLDNTYETKYSTGMMSKEPGKYVVNIRWRPRSSTTLIHGPTDVVLVLTDATSKTTANNIMVSEDTVPIWTGQGAISWFEANERLKKAAQSGNVTRYWFKVWEWLQTRVATTDATHHAMFVAAESTRGVPLTYALCTELKNKVAVYNIQMEGELPKLTDVQYDIRTWTALAQLSEAEAKEKIKIWMEQNAVAWVSPLGVYNKTYFEQVDWEHPDWIGSISAEDNHVRVLEATPEARVARFVGLIAGASPVMYGNVWCVQEHISATAYFMAVATAWTQSAIGVNWTRWTCADWMDDDEEQRVAIDQFMEQLSAGHVVRTVPTKWQFKTLDDVYGAVPDGNIDIHTLLPWWAIKFVLQKVNYLVPATLINQIRDLPNWRRVIGPMATMSGQWQQLQRQTSIVRIINTQDVPHVSCTRARNPTHEYGRLGLSICRWLAIISEHQYLSREASANFQDIFDINGAVTPLLNSIARGYQMEALIVQSPCIAGSGVDDQTVVGSWPDPWIDWLIAGVWAALPEMLSGNWTMAVAHGVSGAVGAFLAEKNRERREHSEYVNTIMQGLRRSAEEAAERNKNQMRAAAQEAATEGSAQE